MQWALRCFSNFVDESCGGVNDYDLNVINHYCNVIDDKEDGESFDCALETL
jgi:hypothetical protein